MVESYIHVTSFLHYHGLVKDFIEYNFEFFSLQTYIPNALGSK